MIPYNIDPVGEIKVGEKAIATFEINSENIDKVTVASFGEEWSKFSSFAEDEITKIGDHYFDIVDRSVLNNNTVALDMGCGTGRWSKYLAPKVKFIEAMDPSKAVLSASRLLADNNNVRITQASVSNIPFADESFDFVFSLGVLHHIPDTQLAMQQTVKKLKKGGYFLVYLYYNFENRGVIFKSIFFLSNIVRKVVSSMPTKLKKIACDFLAVFVYMPFVLLSRAFYALGMKKIAKKIPLFPYHNKSFNIIRNDALDRFGTPLEQRFSRKEIAAMMESCNLGEIKFSGENGPYWVAVGKKMTS